ncbi:MAG: hypothetical protein R3C24_05890 [Cyanobacteriota/Melainabacteria group bacterium]
MALPTARVYETHVEGEVIRHGGGSSGFSAMDDSGLNAEVQEEWSLNTALSKMWPTK